MPTPPNVRTGTVTAFADGFATVDNLGTMPVAGPQPVTPGDVVLVVYQPGGTATCVPIGGASAPNAPSGYAVWTWAGTDGTVDPGPGGLAIEGTGQQVRLFAVSSTDADGLARTLAPLHVGDGITVTDDPTTPPITGFARYVLTSDPTDQGTWWSFTALRTDTGGAAQPPPVGTRIRGYATLVPPAGAGEYVLKSGDVMTGTLVTPRLGLANDGGAVLWQVDDFAGAMYVGNVDGSGVVVQPDGTVGVNVPGDAAYGFLDTRDAPKVTGVFGNGAVWNVPAGEHRSPEGAIPFPVEAGQLLTVDWSSWNVAYGATGDLRTGVRVGLPNGAGGTVWYDPFASANDYTYLLAIPKIYLSQTHSRTYVTSYAGTAYVELWGRNTDVTTCQMNYRRVTFRQERYGG